MEFHEGLMRLVTHKASYNKCVFEKQSSRADAVSELIASPRRRWRIFRRSPSETPSKPLKEQAPKEFLCPISGALMADPVILTSGHTFEAVCVRVCKSVNFTPKLPDDSIPDFSSVIPNLALKSAILNWCKNSSINPPKELDLRAAEQLVRSLMASQYQKPISQGKCMDELIPGVEKNQFYSSSEESFNMAIFTPPPALKNSRSCCSPSSSSDIETLKPTTSVEEEEIIAKLHSHQIIEIEESLVSLRRMTRTMEECRAQLCTPKMLSVLRLLIVSRYTAVQANAVATLVNLSLEKTNKVKIVRSGIVPNLIHALKEGSPEAQEHSSGALFSLALDDANKTAIGALGALPPLINSLQSEREQTRNDSVLALYHLSLVQSNRSKLVKLGAITAFLDMARSGHLTDRVLLILSNLASCVHGRAALLDSGGVECMVGMLRSKLNGHAAPESCLAVLNGLSNGGLRFKSLAKAAGAAELLIGIVEKTGSDRAREMAKSILEMIKERREREVEDIDWENVLELGLDTRILS